MQSETRTALGERDGTIGDLCMRCTHSLTALLTGRANERRYMSRQAQRGKGSNTAKTKIHVHVPSQAVNGYGRLYG
jgi:hypothetical protein